MTIDSINSTTRPRILFVDDEALILDSLKRAFRRDREHWDICYLDAGSSVLSLLDKPQYDIVVSDMVMPNVNGFMVMKAVASKWPNSTRYIMSGQATPDMIAQVRPLVHGFLQKPISCDEIRMRLQETLESKKVVPHCQRETSSVDSRLCRTADNKRTRVTGAAIQQTPVLRIKSYVRRTSSKLRAQMSGVACARLSQGLS
ncbi:DNA-binding NtrC family response regulator [Rhodopirellula rubra]|uniref:DNA-binding NtrC family response regulator n=1 Tax=Aporhodopirellula rubra TaxID=980271 RepID=A0A7W5E4M5_9BACT|nr:response regulator [Aporhodopirellula rubra]MBB3210074.1 DNA-binding NtrC family response regulator [Aporhodopirellula rubra]